MTATIHDLSQARKAKAIRDAKPAMRNVVYLDPMAAWYSPVMLTVTNPINKPVTVRFTETTFSPEHKFTAGLHVPCEPPCDVEP